MSSVNIRKACVGDSETILALITELAIYEKAESEVLASVEDIATTLFGDRAVAHAIVYEIDEQVVGFAAYFFNYSTWQGRAGMYLEDLYVKPEWRGNGAGLALIKHLAGIAVEKNCGRFEWSVLDWNTPAIEFYDALGAKPQSEWIKYRLDGEALVDFAGK